MSIETVGGISGPFHESNPSCIERPLTKAALFVIAFLLAGGALVSHFTGLGTVAIATFGGAGGALFVAAIAVSLYARCKGHHTVSHYQVVKGSLPPVAKIAVRVPRDPEVNPNQTKSIFRPSSSSGDSEEVEEPGESGDSDGSDEWNAGGYEQGRSSTEGSSSDEEGS